MLLHYTGRSDVHISLELLEQIERNNVVLILGHDINLGESGERGLSTLAELAHELASRSNYPDQNLNLAQVAQHYELEFGRNALISYAKERLQDSAGGPLNAHRILAHLPFRVIVTTCLDDRLERALLEAGRPFATVIRNADVAYEDENKLLVVKMYGDLGQPDSVVLTEMDHRRFLNEVTAISDILNRLIASRTLLLLGYNLDDNNFKDLYDRVTRQLDRHARRSYAFYQQASAYAVNWWEKLNNVRVAQAEPTALLRQLEHLLRERWTEPSKPAPGVTELAEKHIAPIPRRPYKFLNAYGKEDAAIFFGRDQEKSKLLSKLVSYRLVLFYGKSGVGKTSLIQAGLMPTLAASGYHPVYARILTDPQTAIVRAINATLETSLPAQPTLHAYLRQLSEQMENLLVLFIDQFEELFTQVDPETRAVFIKDLGAVYADNVLKLKIVLSFREDFLAELNAFTDDIPTIFHNYYRLERLTLEQAEEAIVGPAELCGLSYEPQLVERLLADLGDDEIDPPQLQIVCDSLYEALGPSEKLITRRHYEQLGGTGAILTGYLDQVLKQYVSEQRAIIQELLKVFITSADTKAVLTVDTLAHRTRLPVEQIHKMLDELLRARLVRRAESETQYELAHEYLVDRISSWVSEEERARQRAQEMLEQGLTKWESFGLPLYRDEMAIVDAQREALEIGDEAEVLLVHSAVWAGHNTDYWIERASPQLRATVLGKGIKSDDAVRRCRAAALAGRFAARDLTEKLADLMLTDSDPTVRREAAHSLVRISSASFIARLQAVFEESPGQHQPALEAIDNVQKAGLAEAELGRLGGINLRWRLGRLRLQRNQRQWRTLTLYGTFGGLVGAMLGGFLGTLYFGGGLAVTLGMAAAGIVGLLTGLGAGGGFGLARAMQEPRSSIIYIIGTMLGGAIMGALSGMGTVETFEKFLSAVGLGLMGGGAGGVVVALIINLTARFASPVRRLAIRSTLALPGGAATIGAMLVYVVQLELAPPGVEPPYGFLVGVLNLLGIVVGLELAERRLDKLAEAKQIGGL
jgi:hypothetical protein